MISKAMEPFLAGSSQIRAMFEEGKKSVNCILSALNLTGAE